MSAMAVLGLAACTGQDTTKATLALNECRVTGLESAVRCATLQVPENRAAPGGRNIPINIVVLPATARTKLPDPIFLFAGGPSQAATDFARPALAMFGALNSKRDIVLVDQRGTGKSNGLFCKSAYIWDASAMEPAARETLAAKEFERCRADLSKKADLTQYTTTIAMADIDAVREALGYTQINLWGGSYGTRAAQEYLRRYPDRVRTVILDGVAPPSLILPANFSRDASAALGKGFEACGKDSACGKRYATFRDDVNALLTGLKAKPARVTVADPANGQPRAVILDADMVAGTMFTSLYAPEALALVPHAVQRARAGDFAPLLTLSGMMLTDAEDKNAIGMRLSVMCSEDIPRLEGTQTVPGEPFGDMFVREFSKSCKGWPRGTVAPDFFTPAKSDKPVLILSGGLDPVTPPGYGEEVKKSFSNAAHMIAPQIGHGVSMKGCAPKLIKQFIDSAKVDGLDGKCLERLPRPSFFEPPEPRAKKYAENAREESAK
jgi:pimeloyl-ACP methyl ester carboxylesterase